MKHVFVNLVLALVFFVTDAALADAQDYKETARYRARYAKQAVAVGKDCFFAIENRHITKFNMLGDSLMTWHEPDKNRIRHLNSGVVIGNRLYCAHSNYPKYPMASSIEIFDVKSLAHVGSVSFGIDTGSCTWILPGKNCWYVFFAHYDNTGKKAQPDDPALSQLVQFDRKWRKMQAWTVPADLLEEVSPSSLSGAVLIDDIFYCTGHDASKCYKLRIPSCGMNLEWIGEVNVPFVGQGISLDRQGNLWGIIRKDRVVIKSSTLL